MYIRRSLRRKSIIALGIYLAAMLILVATVTYWVVKPPVQTKLEQTLDARTQLLAKDVSAPLNESIGVLKSVVATTQSVKDVPLLDKILTQVFTTHSGVIVGGGVWPEPFSVDSNKELASLFYNRTSQGEVDKIDLWNNPYGSGYHHETWYLSAVSQPTGSVQWSSVYIDPYTNVQMITASSPYYIDNQFAGVATIDLSLEQLVRYVGRKAREHDLGVLIRDSKHHIVSEYNFRLGKDVYVSQVSFGQFDWQLDAVNAHHLVADQVSDMVMGVELGILPVMLLCVIGGYFLINRHLIRPITRIAKKVEASNPGDTIHVYYQGHDEIRYLIDSFNQKTDLLEKERAKALASTNAKTAFLATLSHEIRTPMNGVLGTAQLLLKSELSKEQRKHLRTLYESGEHMMVLLNEILDFSKIEQGHLELENHPFPIASIVGSVNSVYHTMCTEKGLDFEIISHIPKHVWYLGDKARLRQILFNLLNNAVKFTSDGKVEVHLLETRVNDLVWLNIKVKDTGIGISQEAKQRIFKPFEQAESSTTRRFGGTGLGLAIVHEIVDKMNGSISVESQVGQGTEFDINIQLQSTKPESKRQRGDQKLDYSGLRVLIVEDNRTNTIILDTFMKRKGFTTESVVNGRHALKLLADKQYDLILMDNHMPVMDGVEAITHIRNDQSINQNTLIFGCTADVFKETREKMLNAGADFIVGKPVDERVIDDALYQFAQKLYQYQAVDTIATGV
ncbi:ATP-binding protein [Vibrio hippocampi]|uniref:histidine kinase n=1 Tax=Vibrio hippocampi TaxID=654686 RepID=A0ABM8ZJ08_9VIBR|nr:ATP-binding protein [Vibrio hippocampi]CAH0526295.1 Sensor histidine kinase RcsC [Vibrio hippocampi]